MSAPNEALSAPSGATLVAMNQEPHAQVRSRVDRPALFPEDHAVEILASRCGGEVLQVLDDADRRWLRYRHGAVQSAMHRHHPENLVLPYTRAMVSSLLFAEHVDRVLLLGLGGGSLVRFFRHYYPDAELTVVEWEPICVNIAHELFGIPRQASGLDLIQGDAREIVPALRKQYDLICLDLFLSHGPPSWLSAPGLFDACRARLTTRGVLSANLWADANDEELQTLRGVSAAFGGKLLLVPVPAFRNVIALAFNRTPARLKLGPLRARARALSKLLNIDMHSWLRIAERTNRVETDCLVV